MDDKVHTDRRSVEDRLNNHSLHVGGEIADPKQLNDIVVGTYNGSSIYLRDVARVVDTVKEREQEAYNNGQQGGMIVIQKQSGANSVNIANEVLRKLPVIQSSLPSDVKLGIIINTSTNIENTISSLVETVLVTFVIVMLVVLFFLGRWRATFIIIITIPISLIASFCYLLVSGNTLNIISLSSLSIAIGMVVDDAIVVLENVTNHIERGSAPKQAAIHGTNEVAISVIASTLTMLAVFLPLTLITGMAGILFRQLGWIVSIIMIISTVAALSLTPMLCSQWLRQNPKKGRIYALIFTPIEKALDALDRGYARLLTWAVGHRTVVVVAAILVFIGSMMLTKVVPTEFFPTQDNARVAVNVEMPIGTRTEISRDVALRITREFQEKYPEIKTINFTVGQADTDNTYGSIQENGTHIISMNIDLLSVGERERGLLEICESMRRDLRKYVEVKTFEVLAGGGTGGMASQASVDVEIYGYDFMTTDRIAREVQQVMDKMKSCSGTSISREDYIPEYHVDFDREKLALHGMNVAMASSYLRSRITGTTASCSREHGEESDITLRYAPSFRQSLEDIYTIVVYNAAGNGVRIRELGTVVERLTPPTIERKNRERVVTVTGYVAPDAALGTLASEVRAAIAQIDIPSDVTVSLAGSLEDQQDIFSDLLILAVMIIMLVFIVLAAQFESLTYPFIIMLSLPFAATGVFLGLVVTGTPLSVMALIGLVMLAGIVVKNGIVLIDYTNLNRERGYSITYSVIQAGRSRLRPVLMTTLTTVIGMIPMAIGTGEGSEMWRPMGMTVAWGLSISTLITLLIVPVVYAIFAKNGVVRTRKKLQKQNKH